MSSILDALNKLEEEKAQARQDAEGGEIDTEIAVRELVGVSDWGKTSPFQLSPARLMAAALTGLVLLLVITVGVLVYVVQQVKTPAAQPGNNAAPPTMTAAVPPVIPEVEPSVPAAEERPVESTEPITEAIADPETSEVEQIAEPETVAESTPAPEVVAIPESVPEPAPEPPPTPVVIEKKPEPIFVPEPEPVPVSLPEPATTVAKMVVSESLPALEEPTFREPLERPVGSRRSLSAIRDFDSRDDDGAVEFQLDAPSPDVSSAPVNIRDYPFFGKAVQMEYGIQKFTLNMTRSNNPRNPFPMAVITVSGREKYFVNSRIENTKLKLYAVEDNAIALEDMGTGKRYYYSNR